MFILCYRGIMNKKRQKYVFRTKIGHLIHRVSIEIDQELLNKKYDSTSSIYQESLERSMINKRVRVKMARIAILIENGINRLGWVRSIETSI